MSEFLRYDSADFNGTISSAAVLLPAANNLSKTGKQAIDARHHNGAAIQLTGTWAGTVTWEGSNDGNNWVALSAISSSGSVSTTTTSTGIFIVVLNCKYFRVRCSAYTSGTIVATGNLTSTVPSALITSINTVMAPSGNSGAASLSHLISAATTNATSVKTSSGTINSLVISNNGAGVAYFKLYNKASAPTVGTDTPVATILVPINGTVTVDCGYAGIRLSTGIAYAITGGMAVADTTAVGATQVSAHISYT